MFDAQSDRRHCHRLRENIDCLLAAGALLVKRDPLTLVFAGRTISVCNGTLTGEHGHLELIKFLAELEWSSERLRSLAIRLSQDQLQHAIDAAELTLVEKTSDTGVSLLSTEQPHDAELGTREARR